MVTSVEQEFRRLVAQVPVQSLRTKRAGRSVHTSGFLVKIVFEPEGAGTSKAFEISVTVLKGKKIDIKRTGIKKFSGQRIVVSFERGDVLPHLTIRNTSGENAELNISSESGLGVSFAEIFPQAKGMVRKDLLQGWSPPNRGKRTPPRRPYRQRKEISSLAA